ncbi:unnamed protein product [Allacma fusca]|uniref:DNA repair protein XRCC4 n=1 Tax=Allacma fusca TaxID=39272 RepID=A0A8J2PV88_9HEXA|nr:unnamed protein product [Allacma fusca]
MSANLVRFVNGFASKESDKVTYYIPRYTSKIFPVDLTILEVADLRETKETGRKYYEAYKANITSDNLRDWKVTTASDPGDAGVAECIKEALNGQDQYEVELKSPKDCSATLAFRKNVNKKKVLMGSINLEKIEIIPSVGRLLETVILSLEETAEENHRVQSEAAKIQGKQSELEKNFQELVKAKFQLEDKMTRAFTRCLNTKKERIAQLEKQIDKLTKTQAELDIKSKIQAKPSSSRSRMSILMGESSSDSEKEKLSDQEVTTDYDEETDVQDSDDENKTGQGTTKDKNSGDLQNIQEPKNKVVKGARTPKSGCRKNLFPLIEEPVPPTPTRPRRTTASYSQLNDSQTDSSQEFFIPAPKTRKVPQVRRLASSRMRSAEAKTTETTKELKELKPNDPPELIESEEPEPQSKKSRSDEEDSRPAHSSPDNDDILNQIFAFDSQ